MPHILQNAFYAPELDKYVISTHTHDYTGVRFDDGKEFFIDGGPSYFRACGDFELRTQGRIISMNLDMDSSSADVVNKLMWGSRGVKGDQPITYKPIRYLTKDHIAAILKLDYTGPLVRSVCEYWLNTFEVEATETPQLKTITDNASTTNSKEKTE